jgi:hypothetical protein
MMRSGARSSPAALLAAILAIGLASTGVAQAPIKASVPATLKPAWSKGIQPISRESYYHAIECGKQGAAQPSCVFYDADLCKNDDFVLALYTPYKQVAYEVWGAVSRKRPVPEPSYQAAQRTKVVLGITPVRGSRNPITAASVKRGGKTIAPVTSTIDGATGNFIFDFPAFAPTAAITIELAGKARTVSCVVDRAVLARMR